MSLLLLASLACIDQEQLDDAYARGYAAGRSQGAVDTHAVLDPMIEKLGEQVRDGNVYREALEGTLGGIGIPNLEDDESGNRYHVESWRDPLQDEGRLFLARQLGAPGYYYATMHDSRRDPTGCVEGLSVVEILYDSLERNPNYGGKAKIEGVYKITGVNHDAKWFSPDCPALQSSATANPSAF